MFSSDWYEEVKAMGPEKARKWRGIMNNHFYSIWQKKTEVKLDTQIGGGLQVLSFNDGYGLIEIMMTPEQLETLRAAIYRTEAEAKEEAKEMDKQ